MEDQASSLQLDLIDNGLSHNGNSLAGIEIPDSIQSQKLVDHSMDVDASNGSNGINLLDAASTTTTTATIDATASAQPSSIDSNVKNGQNGVDATPSAPTAAATESLLENQDDDLIRELEQFEGAKKDDDVSRMSVAKPSTDENGSNLQDTSDLLKDLESDSPCPGPSESETEIAPIDSAMGDAPMDVDPNKKSDDGQVDSTTTTQQLTNKRKCSLDSSVESVPKRANIDATKEEKPNAPDALNTDTQKSTSEIDSDTESKLLQENSDGEVSMSDVVEAITSTSTTGTKTTSDVKLAVASNEDLVVSSSNNVEALNVSAEPSKKAEATTPASIGADDGAKCTKSSNRDDEVSSNKMNDTTEVMEQDFNETLEADRNNEKDEVVAANKSSELPALGKTSDTVASSQPDPVVVGSSESKPSSLQIDTDPTQKCNGTATSTDSKVDVASKSTSDSTTLPDSNNAAIPEPVPVERVFEIRIVCEDNELKSMSVERSEKESGAAAAAPSTSEPTMKHTANGVAELCNFMINHFSAMKKSLNLDDDATTSTTTPKSTQARGKGSAKKSNTQTAAASSSTQVTPKQSGKRSSTSKRSLDKTDTDDSESKAKLAKSDQSQSNVVSSDEEKGDCCLARWTDRKYYAGRVMDEKPGNKFVVLFEDGAMKTLSAEVIVFGTGNILPLMDHAVHVLVSEDTYEPGFVTKIDTDGDAVMYTVAAESKTVTCTSSNIYLMDDQAKAIHNSMKSSNDATMKSPETPTSKRTGRLPAKLEETITTMSSGGRASRGKKGQLSPEPGFSGDIDTKKSGRRSTNKRSPPALLRLSESSDLSEPLEDLPRLNSDTALEAVSGVQPELQSTPKDCEIFKRNLITEYLDNDFNRGLDDLLGPMPNRNDLFRGCHFILTCTIPMKPARMTETNGSQFGSTPFFKHHLRSQIEAGGGTVYQFFEEIPKSKYKNCKLIAHHPCTTAKYVQGIAANLSPVSHEWVVDCCTQNELINCDKYILPSGWSVVDNRYIDWKVTRSKTSRKNSKALKNVHILVASYSDEFSTFWQRVCRLAGSDISIVDCLADIDDKSKGFLLMDEDFPDEFKAKAEHYRIPVVSTVWVVQSVIAGYPIDPESSPKLKMAYEDEDF